MPGFIFCLFVAIQYVQLDVFNHLGPVVQEPINPNRRLKVK